MKIVKERKSGILDSLLWNGGKYILSPVPTPIFYFQYIFKHTASWFKVFPAISMTSSTICSRLGGLGKRIRLLQPGPTPEIVPVYEVQKARQVKELGSRRVRRSGIRGAVRSAQAVASEISSTVKEVSSYV